MKLVQTDCTDLMCAVCSLECQSSVMWRCYYQWCEFSRF